VIVLGINPVYEHPASSTPFTKHHRENIFPSTTHV
jgi:hypothetical protein